MAILPPSNFIKALIENDSNLTGWTIETGVEKATPDRHITLMDTGGLPADPKYLRDFPSVQVMVRGKPEDYLVTYRLMKNIKDLCLGAPSQDINSDRLVSITLGSDIFFAGRDEQKRVKWTLNFRLIVEPATSTETNRVAG